MRRGDDEEGGLKPPRDRNRELLRERIGQVGGG